MSRAVPAAAVPAAPVRRRWLAPEVVQTSAMDCGPAALACVLAGWRIPASYGRLREACQTDVDGTSIDTLETVAAQLGLQSEQVMLPADHLGLPEAAALPAIVVVRQPDGATHFVVAWRQLGPWLQVMDPATGRRWLHGRQFAQQLFRHAVAVPEADWRDWAASAEGQALLRGRLARLGAPADEAAALVDAALADPGWFGFGALDAALRQVDGLVQAGGLARGGAALRLVRALADAARADTDDIFRTLPEACWSVVPDPASTEDSGLLLRLRGAVLVRLPGRRDGLPAPSIDDAADDTAADACAEAPDDAPHPAPDATPPPAPLSRELAAALAERPPHPAAAVWRLVCQDGRAAPALMAAAMVLAAGAMAVEALLLRGVFGVAESLHGPGQRLAAVAALLAFGALMLALELPVVTESLRFGRHLETRLRMALLRKLPRLGDRYFHSRSVSDMADRAHSLPLARQVPGLALHALQSLAELALTLAGIAWIAPGSAPLAAAIVGVALGLPLAFQPLLNGRDGRMRSHASALNGFYLDTLLGLVPVRAHRAQAAVRRQHEALLVQWTLAGRSLVAGAAAAQGLQALACVGLSAVLLLGHFQRSGAVTGADLLLVYWVLKLPAIGHALTALAHQYPAQRNVLMRLMEPLNAPEEGAAEHPAAQAPAAAPAPLTPGVALAIAGGRVQAAGHTLLRDLQLRVAPGEHVAIVGASGAGKSSLLGLWLGWHRLAEGTATVDGLPLDDAALAVLRRQTAWVDPAVQLWNQPFLDNLTSACDDPAAIPGDRVGAVLAAADLRGVLQKLPQGLQTPLGEGGALLSGGEGQRLRLGRALMQTGVRLALLDEPLRGLDRAQRSALLAQARQWWHSATLLCVTHDVADTHGFDRVWVVDGGAIVDDGTPAELAARPGPYADLLAADAVLHDSLWQDARWRRLRVAGGQVQAVAPGRAAAPGHGAEAVHG